MCIYIYVTQEGLQGHIFFMRARKTAKKGRLAFEADPYHDHRKSVPILIAVTEQEH